jgi:hypothetical protein
VKANRKKDKAQISRLYHMTLSDSQEAAVKAGTNGPTLSFQGTRNYPWPAMSPFIISQASRAFFSTKSTPTFSPLTRGSGWHSS